VDTNSAKNTKKLPSLKGYDLAATFVGWVEDSVSISNGRGSSFSHVEIRWPLTRRRYITPSASVNQPAASTGQVACSSSSSGGGSGQVRQVDTTT